MRREILELAGALHKARQRGRVARMRIFAALVLMASVSMPALAQASHDTLAEAVDSAIANNPTLMAERKNRGVADEALNQAKAQMGPQVSLTGSYTGTANQADRPSGSRRRPASFPVDGGKPARPGRARGAPIPLVRRLADRAARTAPVQASTLRRRG